MKPKSLKTALLLTVAAVVVASGLIISQIVTHRYRVILIQGAVARAENIAHSLSLAATDPILVNDRVALQKLLTDQITSTPDVAYLFVIRNQSVLSHTFEGGVPLQLIGANDTVNAESGHLEKLVSENGERFLDIAWPIFGGNAGVLRLGLSETPYRAEANRLWWQMNLITLAVLLLALLTSLWFIHRLTRPLVQLAAAAEKIDEVSLATEIEIRGQSEVNKLAASFNRMLARLHGHTQKLKESHGVLAAQHGELDRAHQRVATALSISREVSALPDLGSVSTCIIQALGNVVECRNLTLMVFSGACPEVLLADGKMLVAIAATDVRPVLDKIAGLLSVAFFRKEDFQGVTLPPNIRKFNKMAVFPLQHNG